MNNDDCSMLGILYIICYCILTEDLNMTSIVTKFVSCLSYVDFLCMRTCKIWQKRNFLSVVILGNEDGNEVKSMMI
jgi:hypothetical protein